MPEGGESLKVFGVLYFTMIGIALVAAFLLLLVLAMAIATHQDNEEFGDADRNLGAPLEEPVATVGESGDDGEQRSFDPGTCPGCGTENDPFYTFCRNCVGRIGGNTGG